MNIEHLLGAIALGVEFEAIVQATDFDGDLIDGHLVVDSIIYANDGNCEVSYDDLEPEEAARAYVDGGDWGGESHTQWISVTTYRKGYNQDGELEACDGERHTVTLDPEEPDCLTGYAHDWVSPYELFGGLKENPGVSGHGGGVICNAVCSHCGAYKTTDSWAQNRETGEQGLYSVAYGEADEESMEWVKRGILRDIVYWMDQNDDCDEYTQDDNIAAHIADYADFESALAEFKNLIPHRDRIRLDDNEDTREIDVRVEDW